MKYNSTTIAVLIALGISTFYLMLNLDQALWDGVDELIPICIEDALSVKVNSFRQYNGVTEINGRYNVVVNYFERGSDVFVIQHPENIDSIAKFANSNIVKFFQKGTSVPDILAGDFACE